MTRVPRSALRNESFLKAALGLILASGCASTKAAVTPAVDLGKARTAVAEARAAGAPVHAAERFDRAEAHLRAAEALLEKAAPASKDAARREADEAVAEARCAVDISVLAARAARTVPTGSGSAGPEAERLATRLRRAGEEQRKLEDRLGLLQRDLELTETELIRSKARMKGNESKAEASAAIAEARILVRRLERDKARSLTYARAQASLARAEEQLVGGNFGAAIFFALKAQDSAAKGPDSPKAMLSETPAPRGQYVARTAANLRKSPDTSGPVLVKVPAGTTLEASVVRGDWVKVSHQGLSGWVHRSLLE